MIKSLENQKEWQEKIWTLFHDLYISELRKRRENKEIPTDRLLSAGQVVPYKPHGMFREATPQCKLRWRLARIEKLHVSPRDGRVHSVDLQLFDKKADKTYVLESQSIRNIAPLELQLAESEQCLQEVQNNLRRSERMKNIDTRLLDE